MNFLITIFLTLNTNIVSFLLIVCNSKAFLRTSSKCTWELIKIYGVFHCIRKSITYIFAVFLLLHSASIEIGIRRCGNANIYQLLYLTRMGALRRKGYSFKCIRPTFFLFLLKVYLMKGLSCSLNKVFCFLTNFKS
jgi:hypothetical protein